MASLTDTATLAKVQDDCLIPDNAGMGKEFHYWKCTLPQSFLIEVQSNIFGKNEEKINHKRFIDYKNNTDKFSESSFGGDFYHTDARHIYYGERTALEHLLSNASVRQIVNFVKYRVVTMYNTKNKARINEQHVACDLITIIRAMPNQVYDYLMIFHILKSTQFALKIFCKS